MNKMTTNNRVIVLGSNGFIGSHLVSYLRNIGYYVVGIDSLISKANDNKLELNGPDLFYHFSLPDITLYTIIKDVKPIYVINASGPSSVANSVIDPIMDFNGSVNVNIFILDIIRKISPESRFLLLSSAAVYGNPRSLPIKETNSLNPISPYGFHKLISETLIREFYNIYGIRTAIIRIFSAFGPGLRRQILWDIYWKTIQNKQLELFGTGEETRDFIYIQDILQSIQLILEKSPFKADIYNVANGSEVSIRELAKKILTAMDMDKKEVIFSGEKKKGDPNNWKADIERINKLGYFPMVTLEQGIAAYVKWISNIRDEYL